MSTWHLIYKEPKIIIGIDFPLIYLIYNFLESIIYMEREREQNYTALSAN